MTTYASHSIELRRVRRPLVMALAAAVVLLGARPALAQQQPPQPPSSTDSLDQTIAAGEATVQGPAVLDTGHVDLGPRFVDGIWGLMVRDDSVVPSVWRTLDDSVFRVPDTARQTVPDDPTYEFLGVAPGTDVYVVPQVQAPDVVWLGWNTQEPEVMEKIDRGATLTLVGVQGPGELTVYLQAGNLSAPDVLWQSPVAERQPLWVDVNTHTHANWVFTEPGVYLAQVELSATLIDGREVSDVGTLRFAIGDRANPDDARGAAFTAPTAPAGATDDERAAGGRRDDAGDGSASTVVIIAVAAALLLAVLAAVVVRGGAAKRKAERERLAMATADAGERA